MTMNLFAIVGVTMLITLGSMYFGYRLAMFNQKMKDMQWLSELSYEDLLSETPIYNKLCREYGYFN